MHAKMYQTADADCTDRMNRAWDNRKINITIIALVPWPYASIVEYWKTILKNMLHYAILKMFDREPSNFIHIIYRMWLKDLFDRFLICVPWATWPWLKLRPFSYSEHISTISKSISSYAVWPRTIKLRTHNLKDMAQRYVRQAFDMCPWATWPWPKLRQFSNFKHISTISNSVSYAILPEALMSDHWRMGLWPMTSVGRYDGPMSGDMTPLGVIFWI